MQPVVTPDAGNPMHRFRARYALFLERVVIFLMILLTAEVTLGVGFRAAGSSLVWYDEVASVLLAWLTFYGSALASVRRAHIGCPEVVEQLPAAMQYAFGIIAQLLVIAFFALLAWVGVSIMPALVGDSLVSLPWLPMNVVQSVIPISSVLIVIGEAIFLADLVRHRSAPTAHTAPVAEVTH